VDPVGFFSQHAQSRTRFVARPLAFIAERGGKRPVVERRDATEQAEWPAMQPLGLTS
jgi:hypothetical protein